ncbi:MAG TPA: hypothetical protein VKG22_10740 [Stellaceae bacterium]|nr:hypothetical protein [Stellaceae bacterium]HMD67109.1 hypothetical protein [Stellaceae bacterium]
MGYNGKSGIDKQSAAPPSSAANPLPTARNGTEIPLPAASAKSRQVVDLHGICEVERRILGAEKRFFPCQQGKLPDRVDPWPDAAHRPVHKLQY